MTEDSDGGVDKRVQLGIGDYLRHELLAHLDVELCVVEDFIREVFIQCL